MSVTFEQFVAIRGAIEAGADRDVVLREHRLTAIQWHAGQRHWLRELVRESRRGGDRLGSQYSQAITPPEPPPAVEAPPPARPAAQVIIVPPVAAAAAPSPSVDMTAVGGMPALSDDALPFREGEVVTPRSAAEEVEREGQAMTGETSFVSALTDEEIAEELAKGENDAVDETAFVEALVVDDDPLPFEGAREGSAPPPTSEHEIHDALGQTAFVAALPDELSQSLPFGKTLKTELSLEQYASLRAELDRTPAHHREALLLRYGLPDDEAWAELEAHWAEHFRAAPGDYGRFRAAYDTYSQWLGQSR